MKRIVIISITYAALCILYFSPIQLPSKLAYAVAFLGLIALYHFRQIGLFMALGLLLSACGDYMGTQGNFIGQMAFFGLAHVAYIVYFARRLKKPISWHHVQYAAITSLFVGAEAFTLVVPSVPDVMLKTGVSIYCLLILTMLCLALLQRDWFFGLGATLFVFSDFILAWNKFVDPINHASWYIMITYYAAQWLLFFRTLASNACSYTSQDR